MINSFVLRHRRAVLLVAVFGMAAVMVGAALVPDPLEWLGTLVLAPVLLPILGYSAEDRRKRRDEFVVDGSPDRTRAARCS